MKRNFYAFFVWVFLVGSALTLQAQLTWENLGPDNVGSVTRTLAFDNNGNLLAGSQGGGLWRSSNEGKSWERVTEYDAAGGNPNISHILVDGNTIYVATGATEWQKPYARGELKINPSTYDWREVASGFKGNLDGLPGGGVFVFNGEWSNDNATTSGTAGSGTLSFKGPFVSIQRLAKNGNRLFIATREGLYYSDDNLQTVTRSGGSSWFRNNTVLDVAAAAENTIFAIVHQDNLSSGVDSLYISTNNGASFELVRNTSEPIIQNGGSPFGFEGGRIAVAPSDPNIVYVAGTTASLEVGGVYKYDVSNGRWTQKGPKGGPGFSPLGNNGREAFLLEVFPDNPDELIVAGSNWYTFLEGQGWTQTAQHFFPQFTAFLGPYIPRSQYTVAFDPTNSNVLYVGTSEQIVRSEDRGENFTNRSFGYESTVAYSVGSFKVDVEGEEPTSFDVVYGGSGTHGILYNAHYNSSREPIRQRFGSISNINYSRVASSIMYPGALLSQGTDGGLVRSLSFGETFERFYGASISPQIAGLEIPSTTDTLIDRPNDGAAGGNLNNNPVVAQSAWVLDEYIPANVIENNNITEEEAQALGSYIYFCSKNYVWVVNGGFGDPIQVKWNRITNQLVDGQEEFLTAITVSGDATHTVYVGSNKGNIWRIDGANDLNTLNAATDVTMLNQSFVSFIDLSMTGRSISDLAVDPNNPDRLVVVFSGFGGDLNSPLSFVWATDSARDNSPGFGFLLDGVGNKNAQLIHSAEFVEEDGKSVLLLGAQDGLYSVRDIGLDPANPYTNGTVPAEYHWPNYSLPNWTAEFDASFGTIPVYDIFVRRFKTTVREGALTREIVVDGQTVEVPRNGLFIENDQTIFVATHGRGFWSSTSLSAGRQGQEPEVELTIKTPSIYLYPNPASAYTNLEVMLPENSGVQVDVFGVDGKRVMQRAGSYTAGSHLLSFDTQDLVPGMYIFRVQINNKTEQVTESIKAMIQH